MTWVRRNAAPLAWVLLAAAVVIATFEIIDSLNTVAPAPSATEVDETAADLEGIATLAGLIKVALFLAIPAAITVAVRGRFVRRASEPPEKGQSVA